MYKLEKGVKNVLLVEDNTLTMLLLEAEMQKHGLKIRKAADGEAGWKACQEQHFDLLIVDLLMPVMDGQELMQKIAHELPTPQGPVYATSAGLSKKDIEQLNRQGFAGYLQKPVKLVKKEDQLYLAGQE
ncbi:MAG: response regulator [Chitinophagaceae bacterium]